MLGVEFVGPVIFIVCRIRMPGGVIAGFGIAGKHLASEFWGFV